MHVLKFGSMVHFIHFILNYSLEGDRAGRLSPSITDLVNEVNYTKIISKNRTVIRHQTVMQILKDEHFGTKSRYFLDVI